MITLISNSGEALPIAWRMQMEGEDVGIYLHNPDYRNNGDGMIPKITAKQLIGKAKKSDLIIIDITRPNEYKAHDIELLKLVGANPKAKNVFGEVARALAKYAPVIGGSRWTEKLEMDRGYSTELARSIGMIVPYTYTSDSLTETVKFLNKSKDMWVFKPFDNLDLDLTYVEHYPGELAEKIENEYRARLGTDNIRHMVQQKVMGTEISTEGWWNGDRWLNMNHTIEDKRLMNLDLGPAIGSQGNTVWVRRKAGLLDKNFNALAEHVKRAKYIGPIDINSIISHKDGKPYFLEFSPRFGYDALYNLLTLHEGRVTDFFKNGFEGKFKEGFSSSQRITIPPFPYAERKLLKEFAKDVRIKGLPSRHPNFWMEDVYAKEDELRCSGSDGILGVMCGHGTTIGGSVGNMYRNIGKLRVGSYLQYRTDGGKRAEKAFRRLDQARLHIR